MFGFYNLVVEWYNCYSTVLEYSHCWHLACFLWLSTGHTYSLGSLNTLRPRQNRRHFADDIFKCIFLKENAWISLKITLKVPKVRINNISALVQIMSWRQPGHKPLSEQVMVSWLMHICITQPQWVNWQWNNVHTSAATLLTMGKQIEIIEEELIQLKTK